MGNSFYNKENFTNIFYNYFVKGLFVEFLLYCLKYMSKRTLSNKLGCSRRALDRYLSGERVIPLSIMKSFIKAYGIDEDRLIKMMEDTEDTYCKKYLPELIDERIVWYGKDNELINCLYFLRKHIFKISFFELAYKTEINPERLCKYECGKHLIQPTDVDKILKTLEISIVQLFPQLYSFDNGCTYLPLNIFNYTENNESWYDYYIDQGNIYGIIEIFQDWPINCYDAHGKIVGNLMPDELSIDEYFHMNDLFLRKNDEEFYEGPKFELKKLPPNYYRYQTLYIENNQAIKEDEIIDKRDCESVERIEILGIDQIKIIFENADPIILNISPYTDSNSKWYPKLKNIDYLKKGKLKDVTIEGGVYIGSTKRDYFRMKDQDEIVTQVIFWPQGQYIRLDEIYMDMKPYSNHYTLSFATVIDGFGSWIVWD